MKTDFEQALKNQGITVPEEVVEDVEKDDESKVKKKSTFKGVRKRGSMVNFTNFFTTKKAKAVAEVEEEVEVKTGFELALNSTGFTWFLEKTKKPMAQLHRKNALRSVVSSAGGITLLGYLLYHYRRKILAEYFKRKNKTVSKSVLSLQCGRDLGNEKVGYETKLSGETKKVGEALVEEFILRHPLGVDELLDAGLAQFTELILPLKKNILEVEEVLASNELNMVRQNATKAELNKLKTEYAQAYKVSYEKMKKRLIKVRKEQSERYDDLKSRLGGKIKYRQMTLQKII